MPASAPTLTGQEIGARLIVLEAMMIAFTAESVALIPPDKAQALFSGAKAIAQKMVDDLVPDFAPTHPLVQQIGQLADKYVDVWIEQISQQVAQLRKDASKG